MTMSYKESNRTFGMEDTIKQYRGRCNINSINIEVDVRWTPQMPSKVKGDIVYHFRLKPRPPDQKYGVECGREEDAEQDEVWGSSKAN